MSEQAERGLSVEDFDDLEGEQRERLDGDEHSLDDRGLAGMVRATHATRERPTMAQSWIALNSDRTCSQRRCSQARVFAVTYTLTPSHIANSYILMDPNYM